MFFFFNDTATTEIYTLSLHDALPILYSLGVARANYYEETLFGKLQETRARQELSGTFEQQEPWGSLEGRRSEEHTSELQSRQYLVCRLLLEKKKNIP